MADQSLPDLVVGTGHELHDIGRHTAAMQLIDEQPSRAARLGWRLEDDRVAGRECGEHTAGRDRVREVPRRRNDHDATRRQRRALCLLLVDDVESDRAVVVGEVDRLADFRVALPDHLHRLVGHDLDGVEPFPTQHVGDGAQHLPTSGDPGIRPTRLRGDRGRDGRIDLLDAVDEDQRLARQARFERHGRVVPERPDRSGHYRARC